MEIAAHAAAISMNNGERKPRNRRDQFLFIISYTKFEMKKNK
jgi:hypothetical protein